MRVVLRDKSSFWFNNGGFSIQIKVWMAGVIEARRRDEVKEDIGEERNGEGERIGTVGGDVSWVRTGKHT